MTMPRLPRVRLALPAALALVASVLVGSLPAAAATPAGPAQVEGGLKVALEAMRQLATDSRVVKPNDTVAKPRKGLPIKLGKDGRLTMLLIGSDWREDSGGERLDVIMVASIDPTTGQAAVVSIPRDMSGIPLAGGGASGGMRVNSIYFIRYRDLDLPHAAVDERGLERFSKDIAKMLGTEIDYWAMTRFATFANLINVLGGVHVDIDEEVIDTYYHQHGDVRGVFFPAQTDYLLKGDPTCMPHPKKCHSALAFARSRHGTMGDTFNSDYRRAERQQEIVRGAVKQVVADEGAGVALLGAFLRTRDLIWTDMPKTAEAAAQLFDLLKDLKLPRDDMKVLAPATYAGTAGDGTIKPKLAVIRDWVDRKFPRVRKADRAD
jgi:anionic cell wall polymer biosynthesis LytR-Cps2A-Psr (LCP) family protein